MTKPLEGLKVIELGQLIAGPFAGKFFSEFGADVIKIEPPEGDPLRKWRKVHQGTSLWWHVQNRNKKSVTVDLRTSEGQGIVRRLAKDADVVIENFRPGTLEKWGLGYERLAAENSGLVMLRLSGFGQSGPYRDQAGFGAIGESMGGLRYVTGFPDRPPVRPNLSIGDALAALHGVIGVLMALRHRATKGGKGQVVDVALYEAVFNMMEVNVMERADLAADPSLSDNAGRAKRADELDRAIGAWTARHDAQDLVRILNDAQVPNGKIYSMADIVGDAQYLARDMIREVRLKDGTPIKVPGVVPKLSDTPGDIDSVGPELGEHTAAVLAAHGYSKAEIAGLRERKAI